MTTRTRTAARSSTPEFEADSLATWKSNTLIHATGPSKTKFTLRALTLDELAAQEALPDELLRIALLEWSKDITGGVMGEMAGKLKKGDPEALDAARKLSQDNLKLRDRVVVAALVKPKVTEKDLGGLDPGDKEMIAALAQRLTMFDATGKQVGADALDHFRESCQILARAEADPARKQVLLELSEIQ